MRQTNKLQRLLPNILRKDEQLSMSLYTGELTTQCIIVNFAKVKKAFPSLPVEFYDIFAERIKENCFSDDRLKDAINTVIDTCTYPIPTIASFISFDKRVKLYTYSDLIKLMNSYCGSVWDDFKVVHVVATTKRFYVSVIDIQRYNLQQVH